MNDKQQLLAMGEHQAEQHMCMAKQVESLQQQVLERNDWLVSLARAAAGMQPDCDLSGAPEYVTTALSRIAAALTGKRPDHVAGAGKMVPDGWRPDCSDPLTQFHVGTNAITGKSLWHSDSEGNFWSGSTYSRSPRQLADECESTLRDIRAMLAAAPKPDQPDTAWKDGVDPEPTPQDYRELQERHDRLLSEHKAAVDALRGCGLPVQDYAVVLESVALAIDLRAATAGKPVPAALTTDDLRTVAAALGGTVHDRPLD